MATKKKAGKPAGKKAVNVKKIAPAKKAAAKPVHSSGNGKSAKKAPAAKSIAKPTAKKVAPSPKRSTPAPTKKGAVSSIAKPAVSHPKASIGSGRVQPIGSGKSSVRVIQPWVREGAADRVRESPARRKADFGSFHRQNSAPGQDPACSETAAGDQAPAGGSQHPAADCI